MTIPLTKEVIDGAVFGVIEGVIEGVTEGVKEKLTILLNAIINEEGKRTPFYKEVTKLAESSIERYIKQLREYNLVEYKGDSPKTGGYYLTEFLKEKIG